MTVWFVIPANRETAFRNAFLGERVPSGDGPDETEAVGVMIPNRDGTRLMTGSSRISDILANRLRNNNPPWLEVHRTWPILGWES